jgi:hypothetical protein
MKKTVVIFSLCLLFMPMARAQKVTKVNEVDAIKTVIEQETKAFFGVDYKTWMESWVHTPSAYWSYADTSGINYYEGWNAIEIGFTDYFVTTKPSDIRIERTWQEVKVYGNGAYARFKQRLVTDGVPGPEQVEIRVLEKDKNNWKILLVGVLKKQG